jgi:hypothetical protein
MRVLATSLLLLLPVAPAEGQTVRVSAVVVDVTAATEVDYAIELEAGRFVTRRALPAAGTRVLEHAFVTRGAAAPVPLRYLVRDRRGVPMDKVPVEGRRGARSATRSAGPFSPAAAGEVPSDMGVRAVVITRVIAANS